MPRSRRSASAVDCAGEQDLLAPVEDQCELPQVTARPQCPLHGARARIPVARYAVIEGGGEARLGHARAPGHERLELLPPQGAALAFALEQLQAPLRQEQAGVLSVDAVVFLGGRRPAGGPGQRRRQHYGPQRTHPS